MELWNGVRAITKPSRWVTVTQISVPSPEFSKWFASAPCRYRWSSSRP